MRSTLLLISLTSVFFCPHSFAMEALKKAAQDVFHYFDKNYADPINYVTEARSSELSDTLLSFNPNSPSSKPFILDDAARLQVHQAFEREQKILSILEDAIIEKDSHAPLETILKGASPAYYSPNNLAIMYGYLIAKIKISEEVAAKLEAAAKSKITATAAASSATATTSETHPSSAPDMAVIHVDAFDLSLSSLEQVILKGNYTYVKKATNRVRKGLYNPLDYLTNSKAATVADAVALFDPNHPQKREFNRSLPLDKALLHQAFERQMRLHALIENALAKNDHQTMLTLHQRCRKGYFSKIAEAVLAGYLRFAAQRNTIDTAVRQANAETSRKGSGTQIPQALPPAGNNPATSADDKCACNPPKLLKDCSSCLEKIKANLESPASTGKSTANNDILFVGNAQDSPHPAPLPLAKILVPNAAAQANESNQQLPPPAAPIASNTPPKPLPAKPAPRVKNQLLNLDGNCSCAPAKKLADCKPCLSKLVQQPPQ